LLKSDIRLNILRKRDNLPLDMRLEAALTLENHWPSQFKPHILAGFLPIKSEIDVRPLMQSLKARGARLALPVITDNGLIFRELTPETRLIKGSFGTLWPDETAAPLTPDLLLIPLAAFDRQGNRIGYGQGHYDRILSSLKAVKIGVGFACQEVKQIKAEPHDVPLDYILTQAELIICNNN
jgi:5-formyltetrahydrofolate cyclo-ligase